MHNPNSYVVTDELLETPGKEVTTQAWEQVLSSRLPLFYRQAYRLLGNATDAEDAVQDALLAAYPVGQGRGPLHHLFGYEPSGYEPSRK